jgi:hypothetical protein
MAEFDIQKIYGFLSPIDVLMGAEAVKKKSIQHYLRELFLENFVSFMGKDGEQGIKSLLDGQYEATDTHVISTATSEPLKLGKSPDEYWLKKTLNDIVPGLKTDKDKNLTVFVTSNPAVTPAARNTSDVEFFLNYIPSIFASQMVPYLDVEFKIDRAPVYTGPNSPPASATNLTTPSMLRFLVGSTELASANLTEADRALDQTTTKDNIVTAYSGMEMFLAPQTLTNMSTLAGDGKTRLVDVKPFVPFASITGLDVSIVNAGAGAMAHKKGSLKLKIHDKSRLSEFSTFLRGQIASATATIVTTYGWLAPRGRSADGRGIDDVYAKFINERMSVRERWMVANTSFSFDATGQVSVSIEMVTKGSTTANQAYVTDDDQSMSKLLEDMSKVVETIANLKKNIPGGDQTDADVRTYQILNAGAVGSFPDISDDKVKSDIKQLVKSLRDGKKKTLSAQEAKDLEDSLDKLYVNGPNRPSFKKQIEDTAKKTASKKFEALVAPGSVDPFLADDKRKEFFRPELVDVIAAVKKPNGKLPNADKMPNGVVSFGKLFTTFVAPALLSLNDCKELQICFYALNDSCGPVSGHSVAEFPIDIRALSYSYSAALKQNPKMTIEGFLSLVINTQFNDNRALGYGMQDAYLPFDPSKTEISKNEKEYEGKMTNWTARWGTLQRPAIEMLVETGQANNSLKPTSSSTIEYLQRSEKDINAPTSDSNIIKRIHIYDKTNTPYKLLSKIIATGEGFTVGNIKSNEDLNALIAKEMKVLQQKGSGGSDTTKGMLGTLIMQDIAEGNLKVIDRPGFVKVSIEKNRQSVVDHVRQTAPNIIVGANGTLVMTAQLASKTDSLQSAANIINANNAYKGVGGGTTLPSANGLEEPNNLPLRTFPGQLTITSLGCPIAQLYQQFFVDFKTGTTLDNLYNCTQINHSISPGKFVTSWTFVYTDAYGKFSNPPSVLESVKKILKQLPKP